MSSLPACTAEKAQPRLGLFLVSKNKLNIFMNSKQGFHKLLSTDIPHTEAFLLGRFCGRGARAGGAGRSIYLLGCVCGVRDRFCLGFLCGLGRGDSKRAEHECPPGRLEC